MAAKKESALLRGNKLVKKALASASATIASPEPLPASLVRRMKLPNGESLSPGLKELLAFDAGWLGIEYDEDEAEIEAMSFDEVVEEHFGEEALLAFGEATEIFGEDCVFFGTELARPAFLYVGTPDGAGEYPVITLSYEDGVARVGGFVPFDVWVAQELGAVERGKELGEVPSEYAAFAKELAEANGDGRVVFESKAGTVNGEDADDDDEDENEAAPAR